MAAQYLGMRFIYLEAGSGAKQPVPPDMIKSVKSIIDVPLIVGGGIRNSKQAKTAVASGADIVVTGNIIEEKDTRDRLKKLVTTVATSKAA